LEEKIQKYSHHIFLAMISLNNLLNEVRPVGLPKTWNFSRYIPNFNPKNIQVGDYIIIVNEGNDFKKYKISFIDYGMGGENSKYFVFYFADMKINNHISNQALIHINNENKPKSNTQEVKPEYINYIKKLLQQKSNSFISRVINTIENNNNKATPNQLVILQKFRNGQ